MSVYDDMDLAKIRALELAREDAVQKAGVYVENYTRSEKMKIINDELKALSSQCIKINDETTAIKASSTGTIIINASVVAVIDTSNIQKQLKANAEERE